MPMKPALPPSSARREYTEMFKSTTTKSAVSPTTKGAPRGSSDPEPCAPSTKKGSALHSTPGPQTSHSESSVSHSATKSSELSEGSVDDFFKKARLYLPLHERNLGYKHLNPPAKQTTYLLIATLLQDDNPLPEWDAYYMFGYPVCQNDDQAQNLGGVYKAMLLENESRLAIFEQLWKALEKNTVMDLIDHNGYASIRRHVPDLEHFFEARRETVWRLVQFTKATDQTDSHKSLRRDYGFDRCRMREQITLLKNFYMALLEKVHPLEVHAACTRAKLVELGMQVFGGVHGEVHRFLRNRPIFPGIGYEDAEMGPITGGGEFKRPIRN